MLKKNITYTDYNGVERSEDFYFNLNKAELLEMEMGVSGGFSEMVKKIVNAEDSKSLFKIVKDFILKSYGEKSSDGKRFEKKDGQLAAEFVETEAYSQLLTELATNDASAAAFINGIIPSDISSGTIETTEITTPEINYN